MEAETIKEGSQIIIDTKYLWIPVVTLVAGAAVAIISNWLSTKKSIEDNKKRIDLEKAAKVAEFRQTWINSLRDEMAEFQSYGILPESDPSKERAFYKLGTKIELLMNPNDPDYEELQHKMYEFFKASDASTAIKYSLNSPYVDVCQRILKREWVQLQKDLDYNKSI